MEPLAPHTLDGVSWEDDFRDNMRRLRERAGMTQTDVAKALRSQGLTFHQQTVARVESGERPIRLDEAFVIAAAFGTSVDAMTGGEQTREVARDAVGAVTAMKLDAIESALTTALEQLALLRALQGKGGDDGEHPEAP